MDRTRRAKRTGLARSRRLAGHTQGALAARLGVDRSTVARWENGEATPGPTLRPVLAATLGITPYELDILLSSGGTGVLAPCRRTRTGEPGPQASTVPAPPWTPGTQRTALVMRRRGAGYTQDSLAQELGVARSTVMRWERGLVAPGLPQRTRLAQALRMSPQELTALLGDSGSDHATALAPQPRTTTAPAEDSTAVGAVLATAKVLRQEMTVLAVSGSAERVAALEETVDQLRRTHVRTRPMQTVFALTPVLAELRARLRDHRDERVLRRLRTATAMASTMFADALLRLGQLDEARGWYRAARVCADATGDPQLRAQVRAQQAILTYYTGDLHATVDLAGQAQAIVGDLASPGGALASAAQARALARMGARDATFTTITDARHRYDRLGDQPGDDIFSFPAKRLYLYLSGSLSYLGCTRYAPGVQDKGLLLYAAEPDTFGIDPMLLRFDQAVGMAQARDHADAAAYTRSLLTEVGGDGARLPLALTRARDVAGAIGQDGRDLPSVRDLRELIAELDRGPADDTAA
ncbi:helix-turn-helix transcriptional regulator [Saccharopolyspora erythraea]|uniref:helix-turn-helix domain-containing protein n=1 Tax=Saccharopolyspora erythraea TaxID=1836 RepID=UPI001BA96395|nr:helix-turn-helix transcriptional regulator [Saccharopolyspora erythraea]QUH01510.1 helix-turn-helix transcriptional regulator [Saccharopolyspora erythraea]